MEGEHSIPPYRQSGPPPPRKISDGRPWVASLDANPRKRLACEEGAARAFVAQNPGWSVIADNDPRWLHYEAGLRRRAEPE